MALKDTVERLRRSSNEPAPARDVIDGWRSAVSDLYDRISGWLTPYTDDGAMTLTRHSKAAHEDQIGDYEIDSLDIDVGPETVRLDPRGAIVIGARGRVDMTLLGRGKPELLVLTDSVAGGEWAFIDRSRRTTVTPLTREVFEAALDAVLGGFDVHSGSLM